MTDEELNENGMKPYCPWRKHNRRPPIFEASGSQSDIKKRQEPWIFPTDEPAEDVLRMMFCYAIEVMVKRTIALHDFVLDNVTYRQSSGGSIGLDLTGVVSDIYMCHWDKQLIRLMEENDMRSIMYKRYKDDVNFVVENIGVITGISKHEREEQTVSKVKELAERIDPSIRVTTDMCLNYNDRRLPLLDIKIWIGRDSEGNSRILHTHYIKDVSTRAVLNANSSHDNRTKASVMVNEAFRILKNCSVLLEWREVAEHLTYFMRRLQYSGYSQSFPFEVLGKALRKYGR